jgi:NADH:ubiquinone oxidoreductase subunit 6 (subunit J)
MSVHRSTLVAAMRTRWREVWAVLWLGVLGCMAAGTVVFLFGAPCIAPWKVLVLVPVVFAVGTLTGAMVVDDGVDLPEGR